VDVSSPYYTAQMQVVEDVLSSLGASDIPRIEVFNKADKLEVKTHRQARRALYQRA